MAIAVDKSKREELILHYMEMRRYPRVIDLLEEELAAQPENGQLYYWLAFCHYQLDEYDAAHTLLNEAMRYGADEEAVWSLRGHTYAEMDRLQEAEAAYLEALRENPNNAGVHAAYGYLMLKAGHEEKARRLLDAARRLDPEDATVLRFRHLYKMFKGGKEEQIEELERYMKYADDEVSKLIQIGLNELYHGRHKSAREAFRQAYLLNPESKPVLEILQELDSDSHWLLKPIEWVDRMGGPVVMYVGGLGSVFLTRALGWDTLSMAILSVYLLYVIYSWSAYGIVRLLNKVRG